MSNQVVKKNMKKKSKKSIKLLVIFALWLNTGGLLGTIYAQPSNRNLDVYLLIGQSNMGGRGAIAPEYANLIPGVWVLRGADDWVEGQNPMNYYSTIQGGDINKMNPGYGFSTKMRSLLPGNQIGIVSNARGATGLDEWMPGTTYYNEAVKRTLLAMQYGTLKGILWHQGEQDSKLIDSTHIDTYLNRITIMINSLRADLGVPNVPFIAGEIFQKTGNYALFNNMIQGFSGILPNTDLVSSQGLTSIGDNVHFDTESQRILGERYADKMFPLVSTGCSIVPNIQVNTGTWNSVGQITVTVGDQVNFGPQSTQYGATGGTWSWTGPNGTTHSGREWTVMNIQANQAGTYFVTNIDQNGCNSSYVFVINITGAGPSVLSVNIQGDGFTKRPFVNGTEIFANRTYAIQNGPAAFAGFSFLASDGGSTQLGNIIPTANGFVYVIAPTSGGVTGWDFVPNSTFNYSDTNQTSVSVYQKAAVANVAVAIPNVISFPGASPIAKTIYIEPSQLSITIEGEGFTKRAFANGTTFFTNRTYTIQNGPAEFAGFQFAANDGGTVQSGSITPSANGFVYIIAPTAGGVVGWELVPNSAFNYSDPNQTSVSIYRKVVSANVVVTIPTVTSFPGVTPIAKTIQMVGLPVAISGTGYVKRGFETGGVFFTNRVYQIENAPASFEGFEFLASDGGSVQGGTMTSPVDGFVYIVAPTAGGVEGWDLVLNSKFNYSDTSLTSLSIYQKAAVANTAITIPNVTSFAGASPLAKRITMNGSTAKLAESKMLTSEINSPIEKRSFIVYPNPTIGEFNIQLPVGEKVDISIFDLEGRLLYSKKEVKGELNIKNSRTFKTGVYIIKVNSESGKSHIKKLIIK
jgi:hypothetical protein